MPTKMTEEDLGKIISAQLFSCLHDTKYSYVSKSSPNFSHLTEDGERLMMEIITMLVPKAVEIERDKFQAYAEQLIMDKLKT